jgi:flagellar assembly protein FliH
MTLLSRIIKSHLTDTHDKNKKLIQIKKIINEHNESTPREDQVTLSRDQAVMEATKEAEAIIAEAQKQADHIQLKIQDEVERWNTEKQILMEDARQEGYLTGKDQGLMDAQIEYKQLLDLAKETVLNAKKEYLSIVEKSEFTILNLGIKAAEKIMNQHLKENKEDYLFIVKKAIKEAREYKNIELHVHPIHYSFVLSHKKELMSLFPRETEFYIYPNDELDENGCVIESSNGRLVASVDEQLEQVRIKLLELLEEGLS